jgi:DNA mismatch endonuclease (patch repair protein)
VNRNDIVEQKNPLMRNIVPTPSYRRCKPRSPTTTRCARAASLKSGNKPERLLRKKLYALGLRYRVTSDLPGKPDIVFRRARVLVFIDGDFWHGRNLAKRLTKLSHGHNAKYWTSKILSNHARDRRMRSRLRRNGWTVLRVWENDLRQSCDAISRKIKKVVRQSAGLPQR